MVYMHRTGRRFQLPSAVLVTREPIDAEPPLVETRGGGRARRR